MSASDLPPEVWMYIHSFLPALELFSIRSVNKVFLQSARDRYLAHLDVSSYHIHTSDTRSEWDTRLETLRAKLQSIGTRHPTRVRSLSLTPHVELAHGTFHWDQYTEDPPETSLFLTELLLDTIPLMTNVKTLRVTEAMPSHLFRASLSRCFYMEFAWSSLAPLLTCLELSFLWSSSDWKPHWPLGPSPQNNPPALPNLQIFRVTFPKSHEPHGIIIEVGRLLATMPLLQELSYTFAPILPSSSALLPRKRTSFPNLHTFNWRAKPVDTMFQAAAVQWHQTSRRLLHPFFLEFGDHLRNITITPYVQNIGFSEILNLSALNTFRIDFDASRDPSLVAKHLLRSCTSLTHLELNCSTFQVDQVEGLISKNLSSRSGMPNLVRLRLKVPKYEIGILKQIAANCPSLLSLSMDCATPRGWSMIMKDRVAELQDASARFVGWRLRDLSLNWRTVDKGDILELLLAFQYVMPSIRSFFGLGHTRVGAVVPPKSWILSGMQGYLTNEGSEWSETFE
ncbi:hypothetical protein DL96DRAFT_417626 [Flagelloscypha sp. PMI_526]|nr:hypothetical protein DL96DRAFT_417626 [Flagelloscypha sp. PMI_526]